MIFSVSGVASTAPWPAPRMVGMAVRDQRARHRPRRVDVEIAGRAIDALVGGAEKLGEAHRWESCKRAWTAHPSAPAASLSSAATCDVGLRKILALEQERLTAFLRETHRRSSRRSSVAPDDGPCRNRRKRFAGERAACSAVGLRFKRFKSLDQVVQTRASACPTGAPSATSPDLEQASRSISAWPAAVEIARSSRSASGSMLQNREQRRTCPMITWADRSRHSR